MSLRTKPTPMAFNGRAEYNPTRQHVATILRTWRAAIKEFPGRCFIKRGVGAQATTYHFIADVDLYEDDPDPIAVPRAGSRLDRKSVPIEMAFEGAVPRGRYDTARELRIWRRNQHATKVKALIHRMRTADYTYYEFIDLHNCFTYQPNPIKVYRPSRQRPKVLTQRFVPVQALEARNEQVMASYQRSKAAQGLSYGYSIVPGRMNDAQILALLQIKDTLRRVGMGVMADGLGGVMFVRREVGGELLATSTYV